MPPPNGNHRDGQQEGHDAFEITGLVVQIITLILLGVYTWINYVLYDTTVDAFHAAQGPHVGVGKTDGTVMEILKPTGPGKDTNVAIYFHNSGQGPALAFWVNKWKATEKMPLQIHIERWRNLRTGEIAYFQNGPTLDAGATTMVFLPSNDAIPAADVAAIERGQKELRIQGTFEFCDAFGNYHCQTFNAGYEPAPVGQFIVDQPTNSCTARGIPEDSPTETRTSFGAYITWARGFKFPAANPNGTALDNGMTILPTKFKLLTPCGQQSDNKNPYPSKVPEK